MTAPNFSPATPGSLCLVGFRRAGKFHAVYEFGVVNEVDADGRVTFVRFPDGRVVDVGNRSKIAHWYVAAPSELTVLPESIADVTRGPLDYFDAHLIAHSYQAQR